MVVNESGFGGPTTSKKVKCKEVTEEKVKCNQGWPEDFEGLEQFCKNRPENLKYPKSCLWIPSKLCKNTLINPFIHILCENSIISMMFLKSYDTTWISNHVFLLSP